MLKRLVLIGYDFSKHMSRKNISAFAASTAFFLFLSLIPALMLLCAIIPYTPLTEANLMSAAREISPDAMNSLLITIIRDVYDKSIGLVSASAIITLWSAGKGVLALMRGLNAVNNVEEDRNYIVLRMVACLYTVLMLVAVLLSLLIMVFGNSIIKLIEGFIPQTSYLFDLLMHFRTPLIWAVFTVVIASMYAYVPGTRLGFKMQLPGAAFAAVAWSVMTWAFSIYIDDFDGFNTYGNLTTIIILMLWMYAAMYIILAGAYINRYFKPAFQFFVGKKHIDRKEKIG
ncbi:MAG: YihY/virulence factor BrkB family protein [Lachnospiraceae bacterium]|nr:YihY/virulence factor BrkB family protein [Lachnospiraceae bacterium]MDE6185876.1 YihY/virulence factor BrkB family protein [Lachnospiraceae bacterium]MDE7286760.1 YihY/virulence factor BrkB family protein [Lachnospiraceae bacterium]